MPLAYPDGTVAEHRACRTGGRRLRREPPRHRAGRGPGRLRARCRRPSPTTSPRSRRAGPSTRTCSTTTARCSTTSSSGGSADERLRRHAERLEHRAGCVGAVGGRRRHRRPGGDRRPGPDGPGAAWPRSRPRRRRSAASRVATFELGGARRAWWPAPATPARTASSAPCRPRSPRRSGEPCSAAGVEPGRARGPRHPAPRGGPAAARPRARPGHHPAAGRARLGGRLGQGRLPRAGRPRGRAGRRAVAPAARASLADGRQPPRHGGRRSPTAAAGRRR